MHTVLTNSLFLFYLFDFYLFFVLRSAVMDDISRCVRLCNDFKGPFMECIGSCGLKIHPRCAGMKRNLVGDFDEFLVFHCQNCREMSNSDVHSQLSSLNECVEDNAFAIKDLTNKINRYNELLKSSTEHIDDRILFLGNSFDSFASRSSSGQNLTHLYNRLKTIESLEDKIDSLSLDIRSTNDKRLSESRLEEIVDERVTLLKESLMSLIPTQQKVMTTCCSSQTSF